MDILLIILLAFLFWCWWQVRKLRRRIFGPIQEYERQFRDRQRQDANEEYTETGERKKYSSDEGEYADFEDVGGTIIEETITTSETRVIEEQVTDAEYEEIQES